MRINKKKLSLLSAILTLMSLSYNIRTQFLLLRLPNTKSFLFSCLTFFYSWLRDNITFCCDNHLSQGQMITQGVNLLVAVSSGEFTRELDAKLESYIYKTCLVRATII